jgi:hypothetical protein
MNERLHWSEVRLFDRFNGTTVYKAPDALRRYLNEFRECGYTSNDAYYLAAEVGDEWVSIEGDGFDAERIDWTGFREG